MIKIFIAEKVIYFFGKAEKVTAVAPDHFFSFKDSDTFFKKLNDFEKDKKVVSLGVQHTTDEELFKIFLSHYQLIEAAGGVVKNKAGDLLMIYRKQKWDLPKGKIEQNETPDHAAIREVEEECGINQLSITKKICDTYHCYVLKGNKIVKKSYWFEMLCEAGQQPKPQIEEDITEVKWMKEGEVRHALKNTFPSIIDVIEESGYH
jgi:ADP-ribose pyrophosphatase YjhB (NUDIX family)